MRSEELAAAQFVLEHILAFLGRFVLTPKYEHAKELLSQLRVFAARHNLGLNVEHTPSSIEYIFVVHVVAGLFVADLCPEDRTDLYATKGHAYSKIPFDRLQGDVD
ncbi:hypothetical protein BDV93DRAFT_610016 [Ceratobasidium sp. AG-I]|nr:hypothetical protein BDV93DRAFT_610016 [Ceratobasidium sp. AG-I]